MRRLAGASLVAGKTISIWPCTCSNGVALRKREHYGATQATSSASSTQHTDKNTDTRPFTEARNVEHPNTHTQGNEKKPHRRSTTDTATISFHNEKLGRRRSAGYPRRSSLCSSCYRRRTSLCSSCYRRRTSLCSSCYRRRTSFCSCCSCFARTATPWRCARMCSNMAPSWPVALLGSTPPAGPLLPPAPASAPWGGRKS